MKTLVADDHWLVRAGLKQLLKGLNGGADILEATDYDEALRIVSDHGDLGLVLLDLLMPGKQGLDGLKSVHQRIPKVPIIAMSELQDRRLVLQTIEHGAMGYIHKSSSGEEILKVVRLVLEGEICLPRALLNRPRTPLPGSEIQLRLFESWGSSEPPFTKRQRDVLYLLAEGISNRDIGRKLGLSEHTVRIHISAILKTLKITNRTQAALFAADYFGRRSQVAEQSAS